jgi:hypothetical protein
MMDAAQIIMADAQAHGVNPETALRAISGMIKHHRAILMQEGNSVLVVRVFNGDLGELHLFTTDSPLALVSALKVFYQHLQNSHLKAVYGKADNPQIIDFMKTIGFPVQPSNLAKYNWMGRV